MSRYDYYGYFQESKPISTDEGIKAKSKRGRFAKNWWASRWIAALEKLVDAGRLRRGRTYARKGQVLSIKETNSGVKAQVQGSRRTPYRVSIDIDTLTNEQWAQVIEVLSHQALFTAQLLTGQMPDDIESVFEQAGVSLFPGTGGELITNCSCPDYANPCKHVAAVHYILGEQFDEDPFMIFRLRGRSSEQILDAIRAKQAEWSDFDEEAVEEEVIPLTETIDHFWEMGPSLDQLRLIIRPPVTAWPILKRLGQPTFMSENLEQLLGPAYQAITETALATAFGEDKENDARDGN